MSVALDAADFGKVAHASSSTGSPFASAISRHSSLRLAPGLHHHRVDVAPDHQITRATRSARRL